MSVGNTPQNSAWPERQTTIENLVPAYVLGAAEAGEAGAVLRSAGEPQIGSALAAYGELADALLYTAPVVQPPAALEGKLRAALAQPLVVDAPQARLTAPQEVVTAAVLTAAGTSEVKSARTWHWPAPGMLAAIAASLLLLALNVYWIGQVSSLRQSHAALQQELRRQAGEFMARMLEQENILQAQQQQIAQRDDLVTTLVANNGERYAMHAVDPSSPAVANVAWMQDSNTAILRVQNFPLLEEGKEYQLWLISGDQRTSGGVFTVDDYGCATIVFHPNASLDDFDGMGITPEPAGGSPGPTAPPVVRAQL